jgi:phosphate transport system permease protein
MALAQERSTFSALPKSRASLRRLKDALGHGLLTGSALLVVIPVGVILYYLLVRGLPSVTWSFLSQNPRMGMREGGIYPVIMGTLYLLAGTFFFSLPLGLLSAIYLSEYARRNWYTRLIRLAIVNLAGVPSVVYGLFGLGLFVLLLRLEASILSASLTMTLLILPVVITAAEEALRTVPEDLRHASLALGATKWQTIWRVVLPNAAPGIVTGLILGLSRAAGETAPILFTGAAFFLPRLPHTPRDPFMALPYHLYIISTQVPDASERVQWGTATVLLLLVLGMNIIASVIRVRYRRRRRIG